MAMPRIWIVVDILAHAPHLEDVNVHFEDTEIKHVDSKVDMFLQVRLIGLAHSPIKWVMFLKRTT